MWLKIEGKSRSHHCVAAYVNMQQGYFDAIWEWPKEPRAHQFEKKASNGLQKKYIQIYNGRQEGRLSHKRVMKEKLENIKWILPDKFM